MKSDDLGDQEGAGNAAFMLDMAEDVSRKGGRPTFFKAGIIQKVEIIWLFMLDMAEDVSRKGNEADQFF